jgi:hypothetical protein
MGGVFRNPSGFSQILPSELPSGWQEKHATHLREDIGESEVAKRILPRTHSGLLGGSQDFMLASFVIVVGS